MLPTSRPETSASVASASHAMEVTCWDLRPGNQSLGHLSSRSQWTGVPSARSSLVSQYLDSLPPPRAPGRLPLTLVILTGCEHTDARATAILTSWPPPSPVRPSSSIGFAGAMSSRPIWMRA